VARTVERRATGSNNPAERTRLDPVYGHEVQPAVNRPHEIADEQLKGPFETVAQLAHGAKQIMEESGVRLTDVPIMTSLGLSEPLLSNSIMARNSWSSSTTRIPKNSCSCVPRSSAKQHARRLIGSRMRRPNQRRHPLSSRRVRGTSSIPGGGREPEAGQRRQESVLFMTAPDPAWKDPAERRPDVSDSTACARGVPPPVHPR
jgi:hypothetical protein